MANFARAGPLSWMYFFHPEQATSFLGQLKGLRDSAEDEVIARKAENLLETLQNYNSSNFVPPSLIAYGGLATEWLLLGEEIYHLGESRKFLGKCFGDLKKNYYLNMKHALNISSGNLEHLGSLVRDYREKISDFSCSCNQ